MPRRRCRFRQSPIRRSINRRIYWIFRIRLVCISCPKILRTASSGILFFTRYAAISRINQQANLSDLSYLVGLYLLCLLLILLIAAYRFPHITCRHRQDASLHIQTEHNMNHKIQTEGCHQLHQIFHKHKKHLADGGK